MYDGRVKKKHFSSRHCDDEAFGVNMFWSGKCQALSTLDTTKLRTLSKYGVTWCSKL